MGRTQHDNTPAGEGVGYVFDAPRRDQGYASVLGAAGFGALIAGIVSIVGMLFIEWKADPLTDTRSGILGFCGVILMYWGAAVAFIVPPFATSRRGKAVVRGLVAALVLATHLVLLPPARNLLPPVFEALGLRW